MDRSDGRISESEAKHLLYGIEGWIAIIHNLTRMSRPAVADYVDDFFTRLLFQADDALATSVLEQLSPDAEIK